MNTNLRDRLVTLEQAREIVKNLLNSKTPMYGQHRTERYAPNYFDGRTPVGPRVPDDRGA